MALRIIDTWWLILCILMNFFKNKKTRLVIKFVKIKKAFFFSTFNNLPPTSENLFKSNTILFRHSMLALSLSLPSVLCSQKIFTFSVLFFLNNNTERITNKIFAEYASRHQSICISLNFIT
jgi:hypothetical protein